MPIPEGWKYKRNDAGEIQFVGDDPILVDEDGKEAPLDLSKLRGDLSSANSESAQRKQRIRELEAQVAQFEGVDPAEYKKLKAQLKRAKKAENASDGDPAELAGRIAELEESIEELTTERDTLSGKVDSLSNLNTRLTIGRAFETDPHFTAQNGSKALTHLPPEVAQTYFGPYCKPSDDGSVHVFRDTEHKDLIRDEHGKPAKFKDAIATLGKQFSWWEGQQVGKGGSGSGMDDSGAGGLSGRTIKYKSDLKGADKVAFIKTHGHDAYRELPAAPPTN